LVAIGAFIRIPVPYIPFTLQITFVSLAGMLLGSKLGALSCTVYLLLGLVGVPIFTQGGGLGYVFQPSFGYLIGFVFGAGSIGLIVERAEVPSYRRLITAALAGMAVIYICGAVYFYCIENIYLATPMTIGYVLLYGVLIYLPGNIAFMFVVAYIAQRLLPIVRKDGRRRASKAVVEAIGSDAEPKKK
jgi:biotin transport system substrate-specific component